VDEDVAGADIVFDEMVEGVEGGGDVFLLGVEEGEDDVADVLVEDDVVHVPGSRDD
jgi:hypothetical protein